MLGCGSLVGPVDVRFQLHQVHVHTVDLRASSGQFSQEPKMNILGTGVGARLRRDCTAEPS